jgi:Dna[CI] antecedent, DciA
VRFGPQGSVGDLSDRWPAAVGAAIARNAWPSRVGRDGTVHVNTTDSVWAFELAQQATAIAGRLGVPAVRFSPGPLAGGADVPPPAGVALPSEEQARAAAEIAAVIEDESLREKVQKAVSLGLARGCRDRPV